MTYVSSSLKFWKHTVLTSGLSVADHFITNQTFIDMQITCQTIILLIKAFREYFPGVPFVPNRFSSRFNEYFSASVVYKGHKMRFLLVRKVHCENFSIISSSVKLVQAALLT
jgi:hypothetical protein